MSATLGNTTYVSTIWTAGDVITEAKLDSMVANDQAYDSHAAQGLLLNNAKALAHKNAAGTAQNTIMRDASDVTIIYDANGNEIIKGPTTASAVNEVTITNAATGSDPEISATGGDANIGIKITPKGTGITKIGTSARARAYSASVQTLTNQTATLINLDTESYDPGNNFTPTTTFKFTAPIAGYYLVTAKIAYGANATGVRGGSIRVNGGDVITCGYQAVVTALHGNENILTGIIYLAANDYVQLFGYQVSGGNLDTQAGVNTTFMAIHLLSV